jgi:hypothetical protein
LLRQQNEKRKYPFLVIEPSNKKCYIEQQFDSMNKYSKVEVKTMLEFIIDNIFAFFLSGSLAICWNFHGHKLCSCTSWSVFTFLWGRIYLKASTSWGEKYLAVFFLQFDTDMQVLTTFQSSSYIVLFIKPHWTQQLKRPNRVLHEILIENRWQIEWLTWILIISFPYLCGNIPSLSTYDGDSIHKSLCCILIIFQ